MENIFNRNSNGPTIETEAVRAHPLISWRSTIAGSLIALLSMGVFLSLGLAFGGARYTDAAVDASIRDVGAYSSVWFLISSVISVFVGSYFAARISKYHLGRIGAAQGAVIAALVFGFFFYQAAKVISGAGRMMGAVASQAADVAQTGIGQAIASSSAINNAIENALSDMNLRSDPQTVFNGVTSRLLAGDTDGAKAYLSRQTGVSEAEINARINQLQAQVNQALAQARASTAQALQATGWALFLMFALGTIAATVGGALGTLANVRRPLTREVMSGERAEVYVTP